VTAEERQKGKGQAGGTTLTATFVMLAQKKKEGVLYPF